MGSEGQLTHRVCPVRACVDPHSLLGLFMLLPCQHGAQVTSLVRSLQHTSATSQLLVLSGWVCQCRWFLVCCLWGKTFGEQGFDFTALLQNLPDLRCSVSTC